MVPFSTARPTEREVARSAAELPTQLHPPSFQCYVWLWHGPFLTADRRVSYICEQYGDPLSVCQGFMPLSYETSFDQDQTHY